MLGNERCKQRRVGDGLTKASFKRSKLAFLLCLLNLGGTLGFPGLQTRRLHLLAVFGDVLAKTQCTSLGEVARSQAVELTGKLHKRASAGHKSSTHIFKRFTNSAVF